MPVQEGVVLTKVIVVLGFLIGTILGSFAKALADRSLKNSSFWGRSYCPHCKSTLQWYDLLPIFSYLSLGGKCRYCKKRIGIDYLVVEIVTGVLIALLFWLSFQNYQFSFFFFLDLIFKVFFVTILVSLFLTDLKKMILPDRITLPAIWISITFITFITIVKIIYLYYYLSQTTVGKLLLPPHSDYFKRHALMAAEPLLWGILMAFVLGGFFTVLIIITKGKGMGGGDVKLAALMGVVLGFPGSLLAVILAFITGAIFSVGLILAKKKHFGQVIAFGPFLVLGSFITLFWGNQIIDWYLHLGA